MEQSLSTFVKYCLGYVKLTRRRRFAAQQKEAVTLPCEYFDLAALARQDPGSRPGEMVKLETFYSFEVENVPEDLSDQYERERALARRLEDLYNKYRNDPFTKQLVLNCGYIKIELPVELDDWPQDSDGRSANGDGGYTEVQEYPLFSIRIRIEKFVKKSVGRYYLSADDPEIQVNAGMLEGVLGRDLYYQVLEKIGQFEIDGQLSIPVAQPQQVFTELWHEVKARLRLGEARFDEQSFKFDEMRIALASRANYFLSEDLRKLAELEDNHLLGTALSSWVEDEGLGLGSDIPEDTDLYFPFPCDSWQRGTLCLMGDTAAIVEGPPGTGKSQTIANLMCHLAATGKSCLFVSQKAQALKVVKDKLKQLRIRYLYAYMPNPASREITEEDELDGVAVGLAALESYLEEMGYRYRARGRTIQSPMAGPEAQTPGVADVVMERDTAIAEFMAALEAQRRYYDAKRQLDSLQARCVRISDPDMFAQRCFQAEFEGILKLKSQIRDLSRAVTGRRVEDLAGEFDELFGCLESSPVELAGVIEVLIRDVPALWYGRANPLARLARAWSARGRLRAARASLPVEAWRYIDSVRKNCQSSADATDKLRRLADFFVYRDHKIQLDECNARLRDLLESCGLTEDEAGEIESFVDSNGDGGFTALRETILRAEELRRELGSLRTQTDLNAIDARRREAQELRMERVTAYIQNIINRRLTERWKQDARAGGVKLRRATRRFSKALGKSKRAFATFESLRKDPESFEVIMDLIPIWIMELDDASRVLPLKPALFDYLILDEASQCNVAFTLPAMFRAKRALFVGDSEQMRDSTVLFKSNRSLDELASRYGIREDLRIKATGQSVQSVLDIARLRGFASRTLRHHYRSPGELIGFSNEHFYARKGKRLIPLNSTYLAYGDTGRIMLVHPIEPDLRIEESDKTSRSEADAIVKLFKKLRSDQRYADKSVGVLSFFDAQADLIRRVFEESEGLDEQKDNYSVSIVEGIQGDEKDIVIYSFVIRSGDHEAKRRYLPLTGEGGDIRGDINRGRVNVAFSRARLQVHCFVSLPVEQVPEGIWIRKYLQYVLDHGFVGSERRELKPFDSLFEEHFYHLLRSGLPKTYVVHNQVPSCGFRIDFVVTNASNGRRIAVECDGPTHFRDEIDEDLGLYAQSDVERQEILESAGWSFYRVKYSDWVDESFDRNTVLREIGARLQ